MDVKSHTIVKKTYGDGVSALLCTEPEKVGLASIEFHTDFGDAAFLHVFGDTRALGAAHLIEHCLFHDSRRFKRDRFNVLLAKTGASVNAYTSKHEIVTYCESCLAEHAVGIFEIMHNMFFYPKFDKEQVEREKRPVLQEIRQYDSSYTTAKWTEIMSGIYGDDTAYARPILGTADSVSRIDAADMKTMWQRALASENVLVKIVGGPRTIDKIDCILSRCHGNSTRSTELYTLSESVDVDASLDKLGIPYRYFEAGGKCGIIHRPEMVQHDVSVIWPKKLIAPSVTEEFFEYETMYSLLSIALSTPFTSRTWRVFREDSGMAYSSRTANTGGWKVPGYFMQIGMYGVDPRKVINEAIKLMRDVGANGLTPAEIDTARNSMRLSMLRNRSNTWLTAVEASNDINTSSQLRMMIDENACAERITRVCADAGSVKWADVYAEIAAATPFVTVCTPDDKL